MAASIRIKNGLADANELAKVIVMTLTLEHDELVGGDLTDEGGEFEVSTASGPAYVLVMPWQRRANLRQVLLDEERELMKEAIADEQRSRRRRRPVKV